MCESWNKMLIDWLIGYIMKHTVAPLVINANVLELEETIQYDTIEHNSLHAVYTAP